MESSSKHWVSCCPLALPPCATGSRCSLGRVPYTGSILLANGKHRTVTHSVPLPCHSQCWPHHELFWWRGGRFTVTDFWGFQNSEGEYLRRIYKKGKNKRGCWNSQVRWWEDESWRLEAPRGASVRPRHGWDKGNMVGAVSCPAVPLSRSPLTVYAQWEAAAQLGLHSLALFVSRWDPRTSCHRWNRSGSDLRRFHTGTGVFSLSLCVSLCYSCLEPETLLSRGWRVLARESLSLSSVHVDGCLPEPQASWTSVRSEPFLYWAEVSGFTCYRREYYHNCRETVKNKSKQATGSRQSKKYSLPPNREAACDESPCNELPLPPLAGDLAPSLPLSAVSETRGCRESPSPMQRALPWSGQTCEGDAIISL